MSDSRWLRLVEIVRQELSAVDARVEIGGQPPEDPRTVHCQFSEGARIVVLFTDPPVDRDAIVERLRDVVDAFPGITASIVQRASTPPAPSSSSLLDEGLVTLCEKTGAVMALIFDASSPMIWAASEPLPDGHDDLQAAVRFTALVAQAERAGVDLAAVLASTEDTGDSPLARPDVPDVLAHSVRSIKSRCHDMSVDAWRRYQVAARALSDVRHLKFETSPAGEPSSDMHQGTEFGWLIRPFATIYRLLLAFDKPYTELSTRGAVLRALPWIERLVLSLPPTDPGTAAGQVVRFRARRRN